MRVHTDKSADKQNQAYENGYLKQQNNCDVDNQFVDKNTTQKKLQEIADHSQQAKQSCGLQLVANSGPQARKVSHFQKMANSHSPAITQSSMLIYNDKRPENEADVMDKPALQLTNGNREGIRTQRKSPAAFNTSDKTKSKITQGKFVGELFNKDTDTIYKALAKSYSGVKVSHKWEIGRLKEQNKNYASIAEIADELGVTLKGSLETEKPKEKHPPKIETEKPKTLVIPAIPELNIDKSQTITVEEIPEEVVLGKQTKFDAVRLGELIHAIFEANKKPKKEHFLKALISEYAPSHIIDIVESTEFVYCFQESVRAQIKDSKFLKKTIIKDVTDEETDTSKYKMNDISKWTLRHYSDKGDNTKPPPFKEIKSALALGLLPPPKNKEKASDKKEKKEKKSGHTGDIDWSKYGNVGNTFYLLYIDGEVVQKQKFLANAKWYAEFPLASIPSLWVSSDWLDEAAIKGEALRGSGRAIQKPLLKIGGKWGGKFFRSSLESQFNNFEVKIPGKLVVSKWYKA